MHHLDDGERLDLRYAFIVADGEADTANLERLAAQGATTLRATAAPGAGLEEVEGQERVGLVA